jgi:hypothetical protein
MVAQQGAAKGSNFNAGQVIAMVKDDPTTLYIYPEAADIDAVTQAVKTGRSLSPAGLYWNASCCKKSALRNFGPTKPLSRSSPNTTGIIRHRRNGHRQFARASEIVSCSLSLVLRNCLSGLCRGLEFSIMAPNRTRATSHPLPSLRHRVRPRSRSRRRTQQAVDAIKIPSE